MKKESWGSSGCSALILVLSLLFSACGGGGSSSGGNGGGGGGNPPAAPTGLTASAGTMQVALSWSASSGATSYHVKRSTTSGSAYTQVAAPTTTTYTDTAVTAGTTYYYVVSAVNSNGESANSAQASAVPTATTTAVSVSVDVMKNRHSISPFVYGGNFPKDPATASGGGLTVVRWGGNAATPYNWTNFDTNASADWYFQNRPWDSSANPPWPVDSVQYITAVKNAGAVPIMTIGMLPWVAKDGLSSSYSFSISKYSYTPCKVNPYLSDDGDGTKAPCGGSTTNYVTGNDPHDAYVPLLDGPAQPGDPAGSIYRNQWVSALATAYGSSNSCVIPYFSITSCHFYDMDNEIDIWAGTHRDIHPQGSGYNELRDTFISESRAVKSWDPQAVRFGPVSCCWWFYWNLPSATDNKSAHAGIDFLPWWLNEVYWRDQIAGTRSLDIFDIHAYPDAPDMSSWTTSQKRALAVSIYRDYWDPTYASPSGLSAPWATSIEPNDTIAFRIPRMRAILNGTYPGTPMSFTEWSAGFASESDFSTALGDADAYGVLGRERVSLATRWGAPDPANPNYQALKLYTNYDGAHHDFNPISVSATHNADPDLFSVYAATNTAGSSMTLMVLNKDPNNAAKVTFAFNAFTPSQVTTYTLSQASPNSIVAGSSQAWSSTITFQPYTATLLVISGSSTPPASEWDLNPDTTMVAANGTVTLSPQLISGTASITLNSPVFDSYEGAAACNSATGTATNPTLAAGSHGAITLNAPASAGFCHFSVTASDGTTQGGWLVVGNPPATLVKTTGDNQTGTHGTVLATNLTVTLSPGSSGGSAAGASVFFTTSGGSLQNVAVGSEQVFTGPKVIAVTNSSGVATVKLTLPSSTGVINVQAEGPYGLGHPVVTFTETSQ